MHDKAEMKLEKLHEGVTGNNNLVSSFFVSQATVTWKVGHDVTQVSIPAESPPVCTQ
jgi:hypothetical protein